MRYGERSEIVRDRGMSLKHHTLTKYLNGICLEGTGDVCLNGRSHILSMSGSVFKVSVCCFIATPQSWPGTVA